MNDQTNMDKIVDKIRKLLALSKSPNENEAALAAEKAQAMLAEYNLSMTDVKTSRSEKPEKFVIDKDTKSKSAQWKRQLAANVAQLYFCTYFYTAIRVGRNKTMDSHAFVGAPHNIAVAKSMFEYLMGTVERLAKEGARGRFGGTKEMEGERKKYWTAFQWTCTGRLGARIRQRIEEAKRGGIKTETGTTLPALASLYDSVQNRLKAFLEEEVGGLTSRKSHVRYSSTLGAVDGREAGDKIGLDQQVGTKEAQKRLMA